MTPDPRVDAYLAGLPVAQHDQLQELRLRIAELAPQALETISYAMPTFKIGTDFLLSYAGWKRHCSVYPINDALLERYATALEGYDRTKGSLHFSESQPLPDAFVVDLVADRVKAIEAAGR